MMHDFLTFLLSHMVFSSSVMMSKLVRPSPHFVDRASKAQKGSVTLSGSFLQPEWGRAGFESRSLTGGRVV